MNSSNIASTIYSVLYTIELEILCFFNLPESIMKSECMLVCFLKGVGPLSNPDIGSFCTMVFMARCAIDSQVTSES